MDSRHPEFTERAAPRRAKQVLLVLAVLSLLLIVGAGAALVFDALRGERRLQAIAITILVLLALLLWTRIVRDRWLSLQVQTFASPASEETGVWGVGGPGMRTPGATGIFGPMPGHRSDRDGEDPKSR
jgi:cytochrome c biogenesis protein CcdA